MNCNLILEEGNRKIVAEIIFLDDNIVKALLVGEIINNKFVAGVIKKPSANCSSRVIYYQELELIFG